MDEALRQKLIFWGSVITLPIMIGVAAWLFIFNKGTLVVVAPPPFKVMIDKTTDTTCQISECEFSIAPRTYTVQISKTGYEDVIKEMTVYQGATTTEKISFTFVPKISEGNTTDLPTFSAPSYAISYPQEFRTLSLFDEVPSESTIDPFFENSTQQFFSWSPPTQTFFSIEENPQNARQTLYTSTSPFTQKTAITAFPRIITEGILSVSPDETKAALLDQTRMPQTLYLIDALSKSKEKIAEKKGITDIKWISPNYLIYEKTSPRKEISYHLLDLTNKTDQDLPFTAEITNIVGAQDGSIIFISGKPTEEELKQMKAATPEQEESTRQYEINQYIPANEELTTIVSTTSFPVFPDRMELSEDQRIVRIKSGNTLYDVQLK